MYTQEQRLKAGQRVQELMLQEKPSYNAVAAPLVVELQCELNEAKELLLRCGSYYHAPDLDLHIKMWLQRNFG